ncbi:MAG: hypothetical protein Q7U14_14025 [Lacisediminimonas sp.]|nr:hypothetical protein [Lacisediminimonas sp.]
MKVESPLSNAGAISVNGHRELDALLVAADDQTRAVVEGGFSRLQTEGLASAASFLSANLSRMRMASRAQLHSRRGDQVALPELASVA